MLAPAGRLVVRWARPGPATSSGVPTKTLWAAVRAEVDPTAATSTALSCTGACARTRRRGDSDAAPTRYTPNLVGSVVLASLGRPARAWYGAVASVGTEDEQGLTTSLTTYQLELIQRAYRLVTDMAP